MKGENRFSPQNKQKMEQIWCDYNKIFLYASTLKREVLSWAATWTDATDMRSDTMWFLLGDVVKDKANNGCQGWGGGRNGEPSFNGTERPFWKIGRSLRAGLEITDHMNMHNTTELCALKTHRNDNYYATFFGTIKMF